MKLLTSLLALATCSAAVNISTIHQFPNGTWLENIAQTQNGSLLVTVLRKAEIHIINPSTSTSNTTSSLIASFPGHSSVLGITEMDKDVFAVVVGNVTERNSPVKGTFAVYSLELSVSIESSPDCAGTPKETRTNAGAVKIERIADLPDQGLLNGIAFDPPSTLFIADSWLGQIVTLNASSGSIINTIEHPTLQSNFASPSVVLGVNGIRVHDDYLYFSNTVQNLLGRIDLNTVNDATDGDVDVEVETVKEGEEISQPDDFAVLEDGSVLVVRALADTVQHVRLDGEVSEIAKGASVSGSTSVIRGKEGEFYVSTSGLVGGVAKEGGRVVRVEL
jgi:hypothetical protein